MNNTYRIIIASASLLFTIFLAWYFSNIAIYILVSAVLSIVGHPLVRKLDKIKIWKFKMPRSLSAFITLLALLAVFIGLLRFFVPLIVTQTQTMSEIDIPQFLEFFKEPIEQLKIFLIKYNMLGADQTIESLLEAQIMSVVDVTTFSSIFSNLLSTTGSFFMATFSILFITYFFLRDEKMFETFVILITPEEYTDKVKKILAQTTYLLSRYFIGLMLEVFSMITLITIGLTIMGVENALMIGLFGGLMNIIPYLGPLIGASMGIMIGLTNALSMEYYDQISYITFSIIGAFSVANLIDNILLQPLIYSNSVKSRPIEIFIIIIMAGSLAGITGMILAIPAYTVLRITAKEFLSQSRLVQKLTEKI